MSVWSRICSRRLRAALASYGDGVMLFGGPLADTELLAAEPDLASYDVSPHAMAVNLATYVKAEQDLGRAAGGRRRGYRAAAAARKLSGPEFLPCDRRADQDPWLGAWRGSRSGVGSLNGCP
jgi:hypothetical protein